MLECSSGCLFLRSYLEGHQFTICADHDGFKWMLNLADATDKLSLRRHCFLELVFDAMHKAGIKNKAAVAISPRETRGTHTPMLMITYQKKWCLEPNEEAGRSKTITMERKIYLLFSHSKRTLWRW